MKLYMRSLGCAKNQVDSEMILGVLKGHFEWAETPKEASLILVNTCAFIEEAKKEAIDVILQLAEEKAPFAKLVVCGCLSERYKEELIPLLPEVDRFISISEYGDISTILKSLCDADFHLRESLSPFQRVYSTPPYMRYVKISEGCLNRCAFCAIPLIRGNLKSRTMESVLQEVRQAVADGVYEINLISQDTTRYGFDLYHRLALPELLKKIGQIEGDFKVRLLYLYPDIVTDELLDCFAEESKLYPYFDIPIQHSEDKILKKMNRRGTQQQLLELFEKIKKRVPHAILRTTVMVGFPYEEEPDVFRMIEFMKKVEFDSLGAFTFSLEEQTKACDYPNVISEEEKQRRYDLVMSAQKEISEKLLQRRIGQILDDVFITGYDEDSYFYIGRNAQFAPDDIDGCIYIAAQEELSLGQRIRVEILDADEYTLTGKQVK